MEKEKIIERLETGDYDVECEGDCDCEVIWEFDNNGNLQHNFYCDRCWNAVYLIMDGERILAMDDSEEWHFMGDIEYDDIPPSVRYFMIQVLDDYIEEQTYKLLYNSLVEWLMRGEYMLSRKDGDFANVYTMVLTCAPQPVTITREEAEKWATDYLRQDNAATKYYIGLEVN